MAATLGEGAYFTAAADGGLTITAPCGLTAGPSASECTITLEQFKGFIAANPDFLANLMADALQSSHKMDLKTLDGLVKTLVACSSVAPEVYTQFVSLAEQTSGVDANGDPVSLINSLPRFRGAVLLKARLEIEGGNHAAGVAFLNDNFGPGTAEPIAFNVAISAEFAREIAGFLPVVGTVLDGVQVLESLGNVEYLAATAGGVMLAVSLVPGGKLVVKGAAKGGKWVFAKGADAIEATVAKYGKKADGIFCCFIAGTPVKTSDGYRNIEELQVGDLVVSQNMETGPLELNPVTQTHIRPIESIETFFELTVGDSNQSETLYVTGEHPFWDEEQQLWVRVDELMIGAQLVGYGDVPMEVLDKKQSADVQQTYNITVAGNHNYFAGRLETLVHNCGPSGPKSSEFAAWRARQRYEDAPYHGSGNSVKSPKPTNPHGAFSNSFSIGENTTRRIGVDKTSGEFVVFDQTGKGAATWHGHTRKWSELSNQMQSALRKAGVVTAKGKIK